MGVSETRAGPAKTAGKRKRRLRFDKTPYSRQFAVLTGVGVLAAAAQWLLHGPMAEVTQGPLIVAGVGLVLVGVAIWLWGEALYHYLASARSAVLALTAAMVLTCIGTVVLQGLSEADFVSRYGSFAGPLMAMGFDDIFHSYPFTMLLLLIGATSTITVIRRRRTLLRWRHFGLLLTHLSVVALLIGAAIGSVTGSKGMLHLEVGRSGNSYVPDGKADEAKKPPVNLGFDVRLENFQLDNYEAEYKAYTYQSDPGGNYKMISAEEPVVGAVVGTPEAGSGIEVRVKRIFKRARQTSSWVSASTPAELASKPGPAARVEMHEGGNRAAAGWLQDGERSLRDPKGRFEMRLERTVPTAAELAALGKPGDKSQYEVVVGAGKPLPVQPGSSYELADGRIVNVLEYLPDFVYDNSSGKAVSRSVNPRNPALVVKVVDPRQAPPTTHTRYLFAKEEMRKMMSRSDHGNTDLIFRFHPEAQKVARSVLITADKGERIVVQDGKVTERVAMVWGKPFSPLAGESDLTLTMHKPVPAAVHRIVWEEAEAGPDNPAIEVEAIRGADRATFVLPARNSKPVQLSSDRVLVYREKPNKVRNYKSTVAILEDGKTVLTRLMQVNHPLSWKGFDFYQSNYDPKNPRYSGLQVVHDPGLTLVNIAFWVLMYGVLHTVMLRRWTPWWERSRRKRRRSAGSGDDKSAADADGAEVSA